MSCRLNKKKQWRLILKNNLVNSLMFCQCINTLESSCVFFNNEAETWLKNCNYL